MVLVQSKRAVSRLKDQTAPAGSVSPLQDAAPAGTAAAAAEANGQASPDDDGLDELARFRNMSLDGEQPAGGAIDGAVPQP